MIRATAVLGAALLGGCLHVYVPTEHATSRLPDSGAPAALYEIPPEAPRGSVQIAALGTHKIRGSDEARKHLVVRMVVTNNSDRSWLLVPARQVVTFAGGERRTPGFVYASTSPQGGGGRVLQVAPRQRASFDLLFEVPPGGRPTRHLELAWAVDLPDRVASNRTDFRREEVEPPSYYAGPYYAAGYYQPPRWFAGAPWVAEQPAVP